VELADLPATELLAGYRAATFTPTEVIESVLARVAANEPLLHATYALDEDGARKTAGESTERWQRQEPAGPLDGVPVTVKENIATEGTPMPLGTAASTLVPKERDAPAAARLRESGAVIFTKTTMPDFGMLTSSTSSFHPLTRNPWQTDRTPGGSSSGAAAAAAAGYGPLHVGTDIGGSVRLPAAWCGLAGLKPTQGRVPVNPPYYGRVIGPLTRTVADAALLTSVIARPDPRDHTALPPADIDWQDLDGTVKGLRFALLLDAELGLPLDPEVSAAVTKAAEAFQAAGAQVEPIRPFITRQMLDGLDDFWRARLWADISALSPLERAKILPDILAWAEAGSALDGQQVFRGLSQMDAMAAAAAKAIQGHDYILTPTAPIPAFPAELSYPTGDPARPFEQVAFTVPFNMSGQPAISVNCGYTAEGLPIGLQIIGHRYDDLGVLRLASAYERIRPPQRPWPAPTQPST
jgi:aspartyl-tRNA(Asn)/glutamyl-tRNA(Gln) amidotransferase subunit A